MNQQNRCINSIFVIFLFLPLLIWCENNSKINYTILESKVIDALGDEYSIIRKELIYFEENKNVFTIKTGREVEFSLYPYDVYEFQEGYIIVCGCINTKNRKKDAVVVVMKADRKLKNIEVKQVISKKVYDIFPKLWKNKNGEVILDIWYKTGTDWVDSYIFNKKKYKFTLIESSMDDDWPI